MTAPRRLIVGISGATGVVYGLRLLELLRETDIETHLVITRAGGVTRAHELPHSARELRALATAHHPITDIAAPIASGSFRTMGMIVAPCSVRTLAEIATGVTGNLLSRAADVVLKERRRLVLLVRETPLHLGHIRNMLAVTEAGGIVMPPVPAFYGRPTSIDAMVTATVCRALDLFGVETGRLQRWGEELPTRPPRPRTPSGS
jgi:4-hydroxy-3-polyprenylbenzoate decarboxylase